MKRCVSRFLFTQILAAALALMLMPGPNVFAQSEKGAAAERKEKEKEEKGKKSKKKRDADGEAAGKKFHVPIPVGHDAEGIKLPYFDESGKLQMSFNIESAKRIDHDRLQMVMVKIETYDDEGNPEMTIDVPRSTLDLNTRIVTSNFPVTIRRSDFEVTGETMQFNPETRGGRLIGRVRMLIYNRGEPSASDAEATPAPDHE